VSISGATITVSGLSAGATAAVSVLAQRSGYTDATAGTTGGALDAGVTPTLSGATRTPTGYTFTISNFDAAATYAFSSANPDAVFTQSGSGVVVSGLGSNELAATTVTASKTGSTDATAAISARALLAGVAPTLSTPSQTADGYVLTVTNPVVGTSYLVSSDNGSAAYSAGIVTVTGLTPGQSAQVTVTARLAGSTDASTQTTGASLLSGTAPTLGTPVRGVAGFTLSILNYSGLVTYLVVPTAGVASIDSSGILTISGLLPSQSASFALTAQRSGYSDGVTSASSSALATGVTPTLSAATPTANGFTFGILNYNSAASYLLASTNPDAVISQVAGLVSVTGLSSAEVAAVSVEVDLAGSTAASASRISSALLAGVSPTLSSPVATSDGYVVTILNYAAGTTYSLGTDNGTASRSGATIVVHGLTPGQSAQLSVTASLTGSTDANAQALGSALLAGTVPTFATPVRTSDGYTVAIANYSNLVTYSVSVPAGATAALSGSTITVSGVSPGASDTVTVVAQRAGYTDTTSGTTASALATGTTPSLSAAVRTATGFVFTIANYDSTASYAFASANPDAVITRVGATVTVAGLGANEAAGVAVTASTAGSTDAAPSISSRALVAGMVPVVLTLATTNDGYVVSIVNYDSGATYSVSTDHGSVVRTGDTIIVYGLTPAQSAQLTLTASLSGSTDATSTTTGTALGSGITPLFGGSTRTPDGFTFPISNYAGSVTYSATATDGATVTISGSLVTVTGLAPGAGSSVTVVAAEPGFTDADSVFGGLALDAGVVPTLSGPAGTTDGFVASILNWSSDYTYLVTTSAGTVAVSGSSMVVRGLTPVQAATLTIVATRAGYTPSTVALTGAALPVVAAPAAPVAPPTSSVVPDIALVISTPGTTPNPPPLSASSSTPGAVHDLKPGAGEISDSSGILHSTVLQSRTQVEVSNSDLHMIVAAIKNGKQQPTLATNRVVTSQRGWLRIRVTGFQNLTSVSVWVYSTPALVATPMVSADHSAGSDFVLPRSIHAGDHMLVATGTSASGKHVTLKLGFVVTASPRVVVYPTPTAAVVSWWWLLIPLALVLLVVFLVWRRRWDDEDDPSELDR
jgi:hypothetical protein